MSQSQSLPTRTFNHTTMKLDKGLLTFDFNRADSYLPLTAIVVFLMFADNLVIDRATDTKVYLLVTVLFVYAFLYLLHKVGAFVETKSMKPTIENEVVTMPDKVFKHDDEASRVEIKMHKETRKVPLDDSESDEDDDYDLPIKKLVDRKKVSKGNKTVQKRKMKKQEFLVVNFKSWSKHPNKWEWQYWLGLFGYKPSNIEIEKGSDHHEYSLD